jgi:NADH:ubiquinone oxidoreductase subunit 5 (subunit L)/multisubunit Na+/H+ antiporter MnhA subunit
VNIDKIANVFDIVGLYSLSRNKFYIDKIYTAFIYKPFFKQTKLASIIDWDIYDQKIIDSLGWITLKLSKISTNADYSFLDQKIIDGTSDFINFFSHRLKKIQSGVIQHYLLGGFMCLVIILMVLQQFN